MVTKAWTLRLNWDDEKAEFWKSKKLAWKCADFFEKGKGPHVCKQLIGQSTGWATIVAAAAAEIQAEAALGRAAEAQVQTFQTPQKTARSEAMKRARERLGQLREKKDARRRTSLK